MSTSQISYNTLQSKCLCFHGFQSPSRNSLFRTLENEQCFRTLINKQYSESVAKSGTILSTIHSSLSYGASLPLPSPILRPPRWTAEVLTVHPASRLLPSSIFTFLYMPMRLCTFLKKKLQCIYYFKM